MHATLADDARRIFALQQSNRRTVARSSARERAAKLARLRDAIVEHRPALHAAMWDDFHKPVAEVEITEIQPVLVDLKHVRKNLATWMAPAPAGRHWLLSGTRSHVRYEPRGVVLILAPWNYPVGLVLTPLVAAVAAGNCAIVRPSEKAPRTAAVLARIVGQALDESEATCLTEPGIELASALLTFPFDHVFFTGSTRVGRQVMKAAADHLASVTLELGGKSPLIVDETANVEKAGERAAWGKCVNAGQTCIAPDYAVVHERVVSDFVTAAKRTMTRFYGATEDERQASPHFPRAIDDAAVRRLDRLIDETVGAGARVEFGGRVDPGARYVAPTILTNVGWDSPAMREEIFGPILPVVTFRSLDEAIDGINRGGKPLALYVFSRSEANIERVLQATSSGGVTINNVLVHFGNPHLPFGGVGESGQGNYHGWFGFRTFSHERPVMRQGRFSAVKTLYPPYGRKTEWLLNVIGRLVR